MSEADARVTAAPQAPPKASNIPAVSQVSPIARIIRLAAGIAALAIIALLMFAPSLWPVVTRLDHWTADWRTAYLSRRPVTQNNRIAVVTISDETLRNFVSSPIDRGLLADIVIAVDAAGARSIGLDILFLKATEPAKDARLLDALKAARAEIILGAVDERGDLLPFQREFQSDFLTRTGRGAGYLNLRLENDDVVRFAASPGPASAYPASFAYRLARTADTRATSDAGMPIPWLLPAADGKPPLLSVPAEKLLDTNTTGARSTAAQLKDRVVLIGGEFPFRDRHRVPLSVRTLVELPGVMIHATVVAGLLDPQSQIAEISPWMTRIVLATVALGGIAMGLALWRSMSIAFLGHGFAVAVLLAADAFCFTGLHILLPFTLAVTAWVAGLTAGRFFGAFGWAPFAARQEAERGTS